MYYLIQNISFQIMFSFTEDSEKERHHTFRCAIARDINTAAKFIGTEVGVASSGLEFRTVFGHLIIHYAKNRSLKQHLSPTPFGTWLARERWGSSGLIVLFLILSPWEGSVSTSHSSFPHVSLPYLFLFPCLLRQPRESAWLRVWQRQDKYCIDLKIYGASLVTHW